MRTLTAVLVSAAVVGGCSSEGARSADADVCGASSRAAATRVLAVASANTACEKDADCLLVAVGASCFDACTRAVNQAGQGAVDRAQTLVEAGECKTFTASSCVKTVPPCAPPGAATCRSGHCE